MTIAELHDYCRYLFDENHVHGVPDKWSEGYEFALSLVMFKCHEGLTDEDRKAVAEWRGKTLEGHGMSEQHKACAIFWASSLRGQHLANISVLRDLLSEGWRVTRVDSLPPDTQHDSSSALIYILENSDDEPETIHSSEQLDHERREAWSRGYTAGWRDRGCDFPLTHTSGNSHKGGNH